MKRLLLIGLLAWISGCTNGQPFDLSKVISGRPDNENVIFDYAGVMQDVKESTRLQLEDIRDRYKIEILIVVVPSLSNRYSISTAATAMFSNWKIGRSDQGRGILLLLVDDVKTVKLEVGYALEDVFTDLFTGRIEDGQLQPNYAAGRLQVGLIAVMEEIEARARIKFKGDASETSVARLDAEYLSQGAGARHVLEPTSTRAAFSGTINSNYPAGHTPEEAWQTMIQHWNDKVRDPFLGVYTPVTRLIYRDFTDLPDTRFEKDYRLYAGKRYDVLQDGDYAVIYFGKQMGWENSPFLLCRTREGWQFDMVDQRRFVRMGPAPHWGIEFSEHPYMPLLMESFHFNGQDIPLQDEDLYTTSQDAELANQILRYETQYSSGKGDFETMLALGRLYAIVSMSRKAITMLNEARKLSPNDARTYKYLAIAHVNAHYQYDAALKALENYIEGAPRDPFGHNFRGYIYYCKKAYNKAIDELERALQLNPDNCYAHFYLAYAYAGLYKKASKFDPRRPHFKARFSYHVDKTRSFEKQHPIRVAWLNRWLGK